MKKIGFFSLSCFFGMVLSISCGLVTGIKVATAEQAFRDVVIAQSNGFRQYAALAQLFSSEVTDKQSGLSIQKENETIYDVMKQHDSYAGAYIDEKGRLVLGIKEDNIVSYQNLESKFIENGQKLRIEPMRYSYRELNFMKETLENVADEYDIGAVSIWETKNCIEVLLNDESKKEVLLKYIASLGWEENSVSISVMPNVIPEARIAYAGSEIQNRTTGSVGTIGANAVKTIDGKNTFGVVTAGHVIVYVGADGIDKCDSIFYDAENHKIGEGYDPSTFSHGGRVDAGFIPFSSQSSWEATYRCRYATEQYESFCSYDDIANDSILLEGATVCKYGNATGITTGILERKNGSYQHTVMRNGVEDVCFYTDLLVCTYASAPGDSGAGVYIPIYDNATHTQKNYLIGIHHGTSDSSSDRYSSDIREVEKLLKIKIITKATYDQYI